MLPSSFRTFRAGRIEAISKSTFYLSESDWAESVFLETTAASCVTQCGLLKIKGNAQRTPARDHTDLVVFRRLVPLTTGFGFRLSYKTRTEVQLRGLEYNE